MPMAFGDAEGDTFVFIRVDSWLKKTLVAFEVLKLSVGVPKTKF